jgi:hypothetical protein
MAFGSVEIEGLHSSESNFGLVLFGLPDSCCFHPAMYLARPNKEAKQNKLY